MNWGNSKVLITGGASFIGSHLTEGMLHRGAEVDIVDDFSSGRREYVPHGAAVHDFDLHDAISLDYLLRTRSYDTVFHLAADHGGRGYVDTHQLECAYNLALDTQLVRLAVANNVERFVYASSGCVYPNYIQSDLSADIYLTEDEVGPPYDADNMYGWAKLMAEMTLRHAASAGAMQTASCRYFTVYGPRGKVDHAIISFIARAHAHQNPWVVWGDGEQVRNWTYVDDIVNGTILAAERITDGTAINLGTTERTSVNAAIKMICDWVGWHPDEFVFDLDMPVGPVNRVASNQLAAELLGWTPKTALADGIKTTADWYTDTYTTDEAASQLTDLLGR